MNPPTRRSALAAAVAFVAALAVAYAVSGAGSANEPAPALGALGVPLDVAAPAAGDPAIGKAAAVPALARRERSRPTPAPVEEVTAPEPLEDPEASSVPEPVTPVPVPVEPAPVAPAPAPEPPAPDPAVEFDDSG